MRKSSKSAIISVICDAMCLDGPARLRIERRLRRRNFAALDAPYEAALKILAAKAEKGRKA